MWLAEWGTQERCGMLNETTRECEHMWVIANVVCRVWES